MKFKISLEAGFFSTSCFVLHVFKYCMLSSVFFFFFGEDATFWHQFYWRYLMLPIKITTKKFFPARDQDVVVAVTKPIGIKEEGAESITRNLE